jgi:flagellar protein FlbD
MIVLNKITGAEIVVNADEIETIETGHDTVISLKSGKKLIVSDTAAEIIEKVIEYKQQCLASFKPIIREK